MMAFMIFGLFDFAPVAMAMPVAGMLAALPDIGVAASS
jgi:hypothetical protein